MSAFSEQSGVPTAQKTPLAGTPCCGCRPAVGVLGGAVRVVLSWGSAVPVLADEVGGLLLPLGVGVR
ncbi:hypothetical protein, partial [Micromonospora chokoriensis]|uniref:hypothetical protein n=1 Tax=Micromonospora chokoriensis TaxID=356851 RepID=UPI001E330743